MITNERLDTLVPIGNAAIDDRTFIEWDKDDLDALGMLKIDVLALGMLSADSMPSASTSIFNMPSASKSSLSHSMKVRSSIAALPIGTSVSSRSLVITKPPTCCDRWRGKPIS